jgi:hypothetical protein
MSEKFIKLPHAVYDSPAFEALSPIEIRVLLAVLYKFNGHNNGGISLGVREVAARCRCGQTTATRSLTQLQKAGLITATYKGHLVPEPGRPDIATRWQINFVKNADKPKAREGNSHRAPRKKARPIKLKREITQRNFA